MVIWRKEKMKYFIRVYKIENVSVQAGYGKVYTLVAMKRLPYSFDEPPEDFCNYLNLMFENKFEHYWFTRSNNE